MLITDQEQITYWKLTWKKERDLKLEETEPKVSFFFFSNLNQKNQPVTNMVTQLFVVFSIF